MAVKRQKKTKSAPKQPVETPIQKLVKKLKSQLQHVNDELQLVRSKTDIWVDIEPELDAIGDNLENVESLLGEITNLYEESEEERNDLSKELDELREEVDENPLTYISGHGQISYFTQSIVDKEIMEELELCLKSGRTGELLSLLQETSKRLGTSKLIPS